MIGLDNYRFRHKKIYRKWIWEQVARRLSCKRQDAKVLYLLGPENRDLKVALKRGFAKQNLYAVDIDLDAVRRTREQHKCPAIHAKAEDILEAWTGDALDVIYLDTCSNFDFLDKIIEYCCNCHESGAINNKTVFAFNCIRGREMRCTDVGRDLKYWSTLSAAYTRTEYSVFREFPFPEDAQKHRGVMIALRLLQLYYEDAALNMMDDLEGYEDANPEEIPIQIREAIYLAAYQKTLGKIELLNPTFYSYRSNKVVMDSVVMRNIYEKSSGGVDFGHEYGKEFDSGLPDVVRKFIIPIRNKVVETKRKIAAMKAVATIRKNEESRRVV